MKARVLCAAAAAVILSIVAAGCGGDGGTRIIDIPTGPGGGTTNPGGGTTDPPTQPVTPPTLTVTKIMAFGDSLTEGESLGQLLVPTSHDPGTPGVSTSYPAKLHATLLSTYTSQTADIKVFNAGRGGEFAIGSAKDRLIQMLNTYQPQVLLLLHGVNNVNATEAASPMLQIVEAIEEMIEIARARNIDVFVGNLPPQKPTTKATGGARIAQFNALLPAVASEEGATLVDLHSGVTLDMLMPDGLHLNEAGNIKLAELFYAAIKSRYHREPAQ